MKMITKEQRQSYIRDGFLFPIRVMSTEAAHQGLAKLENMEARIGAPLSKADMKWRSGAYVYSSWVNALVRDPSILDLVEDVIGPDILVYWSTFFVKEPGTPSFTAWHQDATYFGLDPFHHVTAWVALTEASELAGCMDVLSGQGKARQMHHAALRLANSINAAGQTIVEPIDESNPVAMSLHAGEASLHNTLCIHRSAPNRADHRRVGLGISYVPAHVRPTGSFRMPALLVRGENRYGYYDLLPDPAGELEPADVALHEQTYKRFRENYYEQEALHDKRYGNAK